MVVLREVGRTRTSAAEGLLDALDCRFCDILIQATRQGARSEDALNRGMLEGAKRRRVLEREVDLLRRVSFPQEQDLSRQHAPRTRGAAAQEVEKARRALAHVGKGDGKLIDVDGALSMESRVDACWVQLHAGAPWGQLVARDTAEVGGIDK